MLNKANYQDLARMNFTDSETPYTRIVEHKHFDFGKGNPNKSVITREYSKTGEQGMEAYYSVNDEANAALYGKSKELANRRTF